MMEKVMTVFFIIISLVYLYSADQYVIGTLAAPHAGFMPNLLGIGAVAFGMLVLIGQCMRQPQIKVGHISWRRLLLVVIGLLFYTLLLGVGNYVWMADLSIYSVATFITLFYLFRLINNKSWRYTALMSAGVTVVFFMVFVKMLGVTLP